MLRRPPRSTRTDTLCPYTTLFRSVLSVGACRKYEGPQKAPGPQQRPADPAATQPVEPPPEPVQQEVAGQRPALPPLFKDIEKRTFQFFWDTTNEVNGITTDRFL